MSGVRGGTATGLPGSGGMPPWQGRLFFFAVAYAIRRFLSLRITSSRPGTVVQLPGATTALYLEHLFR